MATNDETKLTCANSMESIPALFDSLSQPQHSVMKKMLDLEKGLQPEHQKILDELAPNFMVNNDDLKRLQEALFIFERIHDAGLLNDAFKLLELFLANKTRLIQKCQAQKYHKQTAKATASHGKYGPKKKQLLLALEKFLVEVENAWHPVDEPCSPIRNAKTNKTNAMERVFKNHESEITAILKGQGIEKGFKKEFFYAFNAYTEWYYENTANHTTRNGNKRETRAARTEESKLNSSKAAKKKWNERKQGKRTIKK